MGIRRSEHCTLRGHVAAAAGAVGGFVDLGSGAGRATLAAARLVRHGFQLCFGIEVWEPLHIAAEGALARCREEWGAVGELAEVVLMHADVRDVHWWEGIAIAFCYAATWSKDLLMAVVDGACKLQPGARLLIVGQRLPEAAVSNFFQESHVDCEMDRGEQSTVWVYARKGGT